MKHPKMTTHPQPCDASDPEHIKWCPAMDRCLNPRANYHGKGLTVIVLTHMETFKPRVAGVAYKKSAKDGDGIFLNNCPWCGAALQSEFDKSRGINAQPDEDDGEPDEGEVEVEEEEPGVFRARAGKGVDLRDVLPKGSES